MMSNGSNWVSIDVAFPAPGRMAPFQVGGLSLLLCNAEGEPHVIGATCPHARVGLGEGVLRGCILECPLHGGKLDVRDGSPVAPPIRVPAQTYPVRSGEGGLEVALPEIP